MNSKSYNGDQALAYGAIASGVKLVSSYPGSPSSGTVNSLISLAEKHDIYIEWSGNEKVAIEMGIGASIAGRRALVCTKSVGMNLMTDPLMALNLTPVNGGLVILLGDDPGAYGSQNDQDTRSLVHMLEIPMVEPASPSEAFEMIQEAFKISEQLNTAVIIRETRSFSQQVEEFNIPELHYSRSDLGLKREKWRFVPVPENAVQKHRDLHNRLKQLVNWAETLSYNRRTGSGKYGIITSGFVYKKTTDVLGENQGEIFSVLKISNLFPLPEKRLSNFIESCNKILVLEENEPFIESQTKIIAHDNNYKAVIYGKASNHVSREGELFRWQIQKAITRFYPEFEPARGYLEENEAEERPTKKNFCRDCNYGEILDVLDEAADSLGQKPVIVGDPGCLVTVGERLDAKYAIGSAVGIASGIEKAGTSERAVAIFGDSSFFHTSLPAICNAVYNNSNILMILLDNKATAATGFQPNPGMGKNAFGKKAPILNIENISRACGVKNIRTIDPDENNSALKNLFLEALTTKDLSMIIIRTD